MKRYFVVAFGIMFIALGAIAGIGHQSGARAQAIGQPMILPVDDDRLVIETGEGTTHSFSIEIADNESARSRGLMFREQMDDDHGMLFIYDQPRRPGFWMKNTPMPLDLLFIDDYGVILSIMPGEPFSTAAIAPDVIVRFVLEVKRGTAQKAGITEGDWVSHPRIDAAGEAAFPSEPSE